MDNEWVRLTGDRTGAGHRHPLFYCHTKTGHMIARKWWTTIHYDSHQTLSPGELLELCRVSGVYRQLPEVKALVEALHDLEWIENDRGYEYCYVCGEEKGYPHLKACPVALALAPFTEDAE